MLSTQHVMCTALFSDRTYFNEIVSSVVFPDAIRAYSGPRGYSHFEENPDGTDCYWWEMPDNMKTVSPESIKESLRRGSHVPENKGTAVMGEKTNIMAFVKHNRHLPVRMFYGIEHHLRQDVVFDEFIRRYIDVSRRAEGIYTLGSGEVLDGAGVRKLATKIEEHGLYVLAKVLYYKKGITVNQDWFESVVKPILLEDYPLELAEKTYSFMKVPDMVNTWITNHDWSHAEEGPIPLKDYVQLYTKVIYAMGKPSLIWEADK